MKNEYTLSELAKATGIPRSRLRWRADHAGLPTVRPSGNPDGKRVVTRAMLMNRPELVDLRDAILLREELGPDDAEDERPIQRVA